MLSWSSERSYYTKTRQPQAAQNYALQYIPQTNYTAFLAFYPSSSVVITHSAASAAAVDQEPEISAEQQVSGETHDSLQHINKIYTIGSKP